MDGNGFALMEWLVIIDIACHQVLVLKRLVKKYKIKIILKDFLKMEKSKIDIED